MIFQHPSARLAWWDPSAPLYIWNTISIVPLPVKYQSSFTLLRSSTLMYKFYLGMGTFFLPDVCGLPVEKNIGDTVVTLV